MKRNGHEAKNIETEKKPSETSFFEAKQNRHEAKNIETEKKLAKHHFFKQNKTDMKRKISKRKNKKRNIVF